MKKMRVLAFLLILSLSAGLAATGKADNQVPKKAKKAYEKAVEFVKAKQIDKAEEALRESLQLEAEWAPPYALLGSIKRSQNRTDEALANFEKASLEFARATEKFVPMTEDMNRLIRTIETNTQETLGNISRRFSSEELGQAIKDVRAFLDTASVSLKKVESVLLEQQSELTRTFSTLGVAVENLARFSREIADEPSSLIRTRKEKKK